MATTDTAQAKHRLGQLHQKMVDRQAEALDSPSATVTEQRTYQEKLPALLGDQAADAAESAYLLQEYLDQEEAAAAMENYRDVLRQASTPDTDETGPNPPTAPQWRTLRQGLQRSLTDQQLEDLQADHRISNTIKSSQEAAMMTWKPDQPAEHTSQATSQYQQALADWRTSCSVAELNGETIVYDPGHPVRSAVDEVMTEDQRMARDQAVIGAKLSQALGPHEGLDEAAQIGTSTINDWENHGIPPLDTHQGKQKRQPQADHSPGEKPVKQTSISTPTSTPMPAEIEPTSSGPDLD